MKSGGKRKFIALNLLGLLMFPLFAQAGDLDDGISEATEEAVSGDESISNKDVNISFIVTDALSKSKNRKKETPGEKEVPNHEITNLDDGKSENNENSIVVGAGSRVDKVTNIVIQK